MLGGRRPLAERGISGRLALARSIVFSALALARVWPVWLVWPVSHAGAVEGAARKKDEDLVEVDRQLAAAERFLKKGEWDRADSRLDMAARLRPDDPRVLLDRARSDAGRGRCPEALAKIDRYLQLVPKPDQKALEVLVRCPRSAEAAAPSVGVKPAPSLAQAPAAKPAPVADGAAPATEDDAEAPAEEQRAVEPPAEAPPHRVERPRAKRGHLFLIDLGAGLRVPVISDAVNVDFLGSVTLGVALSNRVGLDLVLIAESTVSRAPVQAGSEDNVTVFSENLLLGLEERRQVWRRLAVFGTIAAGITVDSFHGFVAAAALHADVGLALVVGPGEFRIRPANFSFLVSSDAFGAAYGVTAGYAFRL
jgi:hypothetical protein